jgi:hypothetical protein
MPPGLSTSSTEETGTCSTSPWRAHFLSWVCRRVHPVGHVQCQPARGGEQALAAFGKCFPFRTTLPMLRDVCVLVYTSSAAYVLAFPS